MSDGKKPHQLKRDTFTRDEQTVPGYRQPPQEPERPEEMVPQAPQPVPLTGPPRPEIGPIPSER
jgi:hypothetical protein